MLSLHQENVKLNFIRTDFIIKLFLLRYDGGMEFSLVLYYLVKFCVFFDLILTA